jgi:F-type H+-transporting ATPase subunit delta
MISSAVLVRYARAFADIALETGQEDQVLSDLETYEEIFKAVPDLLPAFDSPAIPREAKEKLLSELLTRYPVCRITANFLRVLLSHHRLRYFLEICGRYILIVNERKGIVFAQVRSATPLSDGDLAVLRESLSRATGKSITVEVRTEPELLGGLIVQIGSIVYDGSIRTQLNEMKRCLAGGQAIQIRG